MNWITKIIKAGEKIKTALEKKGYEADYNNAMDVS